MLWTIMQEDAILEGIDQLSANQYKQYQGKDIIYRSNENGKDVIVQLLSTNPNDFLDQSLEPGKEILPKIF